MDDHDDNDGDDKAHDDDAHDGGGGGCVNGLYPFQFMCKVSNLSYGILINIRCM